MFEWFKRFQKSAPAPLAGTPVRRRQKTYTADSGYVYEYFYEGYRVESRQNQTGAEHIFSVSADRKTWFSVQVFLPDHATAAWEAENGRDLSSTERYAVVKMALFQAFDERDRPPLMQQPVLIRPADIEEILANLDIE